jgi:glycosyltransferase involved in cell wall biosynthesis
MTSRRLKVVHVHKMTGVSGSEQHLRILLTALDPARYAPTLLMLTTPAAIPGDYIATLTAAGVRVEQLRIRADFDPFLLWRLTAWFKRERPDIVHTHLIHADVHGLLAARAAGVPAIVASKHNDDPFRSNAVIRASEAWLARRTARVIAISERVREMVLSDGRIDPRRVLVIPYGYESPVRKPRQDVRRPLGIPADAPLLVAVGRLVRQKGHDTLIRAFQTVLRERPEARLVIVGGGPLEPDLRRLASELGVASACVLAGPRDNALDFIDEASVFVHPSRWEGFGIVLLEAMAAGKPVVATRISAIPEVVEDGRTGLLVRPDEPEELARALVEMLSRTDRDVFGRRGRERLESRFSARIMAQATEKVYEAALSDRSLRKAG